MKIQMLEVSKISVTKDHLRVDSDVSDLVDSFNAVGAMFEPLVVNANYELLAGGRRYAAACQVGWERVPVHIFSGDEIDEQIIAVDENLARKSLTGAERDKAMKVQKDLYSRRLTAQSSDSKRPSDRQVLREIANKHNVSERSAYQSRARDEKLAAAAKTAFAEKKITQSQADELCKLNGNQQEELVPVIAGKSKRHTKEIFSQYQHSGLKAAKKEAQRLENHEHSSAMLASLTDLVESAESSLRSDQLTPFLGDSEIHKKEITTASRLLPVIFEWLDGRSVKKVCSECRVELILTEFSTGGRNFQGRYRFDSRCRPCERKMRSSNSKLQSKAKKNSNHRNRKLGPSKK